MSFPEKEEQILKFWDQEKVFEKSLEARTNSPNFLFYDGPPFATGLPHYGHILASTIKDVIPRYQTMTGNFVRRVWGWDCHGLPIENIVERELKISGKKQIEEFGVKKYNETCRSKVLTYAGEWGEMVRRMGRFVDFEHSYKTMDATYMESVWWAIKQIYDKGLLYEGRKVLLYCSRCETPISNFEVAMDNSYKDVTEESVTARFLLKDAFPVKLPKDLPIYFLAWTTTPWTLPGNVALAVGPEIPYVVVEQDNTYYIVAEARRESIVGNSGEVVTKLKGEQLSGLNYKPLFDIPLFRGEHCYYVTTADFVTTEDGTGIVHTAAVYGEDDHQLALKIGLPIKPMLDAQGKFIEGTPLVAGMFFKKADKIVLQDLQERQLAYRVLPYTHSYPFCYRCATPLFYNALPSWFINVQKIKPKLLKYNEKINWYPKHLKHGRFQKGIESAPDWNISRNRYWATPIPIWRCSQGSNSPQPSLNLREGGVVPPLRLRGGVEGLRGGGEVGCGKIKCVGSLKELAELSVNYDQIYSSHKIEEVDLHRPMIDEIRLKCECGGEMRRVPEVLDCWVESGSMPFAQFHYPFANKQEFDQQFPAQFVSEYIPQTRAWFYVMHVISTILFDQPAVTNIVTTGNILAEDGSKMSKSKKNYPDPWVLIEKYGIDALRLYLMGSKVMEGEDINFSEREVDEIYKKTILILENVVSFYKIYASETSKLSEISKVSHVLDRWLAVKLSNLVRQVTEALDSYNTVLAVRLLRDFASELSTWYVRLSRDRFKAGDAAGIESLGFTLLTLSKLFSPLAPFLGEAIYQSVADTKKSVHLEDWPIADGSADAELLISMQLVQGIVELGHAIRAEAGLKVRQPLTKAFVTAKLGDELLELVAQELNVGKALVGEVPTGEQWRTKGDAKLMVALDTLLTPELQEKGLLRDLVRQVNALRKKQGLTIKDRVAVIFKTDSADLTAVITKYGDELQQGTLTSAWKSGEGGGEVRVGDHVVFLSIK